jgi:hypothetical protein
MYNFFFPLAVQYPILQRMVRGRPPKGSDYVERTRVNYRLPPDIAEAIKQVARRKGLSQTAYVELVFREKLQTEESLTTAPAPGKKAPQRRRKKIN